MHLILSKLWILFPVLFFGEEKALSTKKKYAAKASATFAAKSNLYV
jgi:hypothetical protein